MFRSKFLLPFSEEEAKQQNNLECLDWKCFAPAAIGQIRLRKDNTGCHDGECDGCWILMYDAL